MATMNASRLRKVNDRAKNRPRPLTATQKNVLLLKKLASIAGIALVGGVIGATVGISTERDQNMDSYSHQAYSAGETQGKKSWYASVVKANEKNHINIADIKMPEDSFIQRDNGTLYCKSRLTEAAGYTLGFMPEFECAQVTSRVESFSIAELEKVIPEKGSIERNSGENYECNNGSISKTDLSLTECVVFLREQLASEYNSFVKENYETKYWSPLMISSPPQEVELSNSASHTSTTGDIETLGGSMPTKSVSGTSGRALSDGWSSQFTPHPEIVQGKGGIDISG